MGEATVSVVIVNWNTRDLLRRCLRSLAGASPPPDEIVIVDNASSDGSAELARAEFPQATLIANADNRMYAAANNQGMTVARSQYVWLLNPDTEVGPDTQAKLVALFDTNPRAGAVACKLIYPATHETVSRRGLFFTLTVKRRLPELQASVRAFPTPLALLLEASGLSRLFPRSRFFGQYRMTWWNYDDEREVDQPMTSCLMLRRAALTEVGLFDEQFPLFFNDVDLCYRLKQAGWSIWFTPATSVVHHLGASTKQIGARAIRESHEGLLRFYAKHYAGRFHPLVYCATRALIRAGLWARLLLARA